MQQGRGEILYFIGETIQRCQIFANVANVLTGIEVCEKLGQAGVGPNKSSPGGFLLHEHT